MEVLVNFFDIVPAARPSIPLHSLEMSSSVPRVLTNVTFHRCYMLREHLIPYLFYSPFEWEVNMDSQSQNNPIFSIFQLGYIPVFVYLFKKMYQHLGRKSFPIEKCSEAFLEAYFRFSRRAQQEIVFAKMFDMSPGYSWNSLYIETTYTDIFRGYRQA